LNLAPLATGTHIREKERSDGGPSLLSMRTLVPKLE
jgi:hypothetical protein